MRRDKFWLLVRPGGFSWGFPVFEPPNNMALFKVNEIILTGSKPKSWLRMFNKTRNKGVHIMKLVM